MLITPISNNSTSHIKYPQTSFLGVRTKTLGKVRSATDTFVKAKEPSLKSLKDEFFSLIEKTNIMNTKKRGWKSFFVFEDSPEDQKKLLLANNLFLREFVNNDYLLNNDSLRENFFTILVKTLGSKHMAECRLSVLNKITSNLYGFDVPAGTTGLLFVRNNPQLTYNEIVNAIPFGIEKYSEIQKWKETTPDKSKDKRWREEKENLMVSADGITFAFTREIGIGNIGEIIKFGEEQGYTIEPII